MNTIIILHAKCSVSDTKQQNCINVLGNAKLGLQQDKTTTKYLIGPSFDFWWITVSNSKHSNEKGEWMLPACILHIWSGSGFQSLGQDLHIYKKKSKYDWH